MVACHFLCHASFLWWAVTMHFSLCSGMVYSPCPTLLFLEFLNNSCFHFLYIWTLAFHFNDHVRYISHTDDARLCPIITASTKILLVVFLVLALILFVSSFFLHISPPFVILWDSSLFFTQVLCHVITSFTVLIIVLNIILQITLYNFPILWKFSWLLKDQYIVLPCDGAKV